MQSVGTRLREARIKKGYTLEEINARTRISLKNLNAIESDDLAKISSPFTYRSFVKQICDLVGLDHATVVADAQVASSTMPEPLVPGQEEEVFVRPHQYQQIKPKSSFNWLRMASIAGAAGVLSIYLIWRNGGITSAKIPANVLPAASQIAAPSESSPAAMQTATGPQQPQSLTSAAPSVTADPATAKMEQPAAQPRAQLPSPAPAPGTEQLLPPSQVPVHTEAPVQTAVPAASQVSAVTPPANQESEAASIHIELSAIQPTWLTISADGKTTYSGTLGAMKTMSFNGKQTAQIRTANAGGVNIIFNGRALGPLGRRGQSRTFVFTKTGYEVVQGVGSSTPRVVPTGG